MGSDIAEVTVDEVPSEFEEAAQQAADECPAEVIIVE
jgi:ferredoxin